jgi:hypothetical protein
VSGRLKLAQVLQGLEGENGRGKVSDGLSPNLSARRQKLARAFREEAWTPNWYEIHETQLWRVADGNVFSLPRLDSVEFSVDGRTLAGASWSEEKPPGVWSTATGKLKWSRGDETDRTDRSTDGPELRLAQIWGPRR